jgi:hypothetical protein
LGARALEADERREGGAERCFRGTGRVRAAGAAGPDLNDPECLQGAERLADGRAPDAEALGELPLVRQTGSFGDVAGEDRVADLEEDVVESEGGGLA